MTLAVGPGHALADGGHVKVQLGASTLKLHLPEHVRCEVEVEVE